MPGLFGSGAELPAWAADDAMGEQNVPPAVVLSQTQDTARLTVVFSPSSSAPFSSPTWSSPTTP